MLQATTGESMNCGQTLVRSATASAQRAFEQDCKTMDRFANCLTWCAFHNFIGADPGEVAVNLHKEAILHALERSAKEFAKVWAERLISFVGKIEMARDGYHTFTCTTNCQAGNQ